MDKRKTKKKDNKKFPYRISSGKDKSAVEGIKNGK